MKKSDKLSREQVGRIFPNRGDFNITSDNYDIFTQKYNSEIEHFYNRLQNLERKYTKPSQLFSHAETYDFVEDQIKDRKPNISGNSNPLPNDIEFNINSEYVSYQDSAPTNYLEVRKGILKSIIAAWCNYQEILKEVNTNQRELETFLKKFVSICLDLTILFTESFEKPSGVGSKKTSDDYIIAPLEKVIDKTIEIQKEYEHEVWVPDSAKDDLVKALIQLKNTRTKLLEPYDLDRSRSKLEDYYLKELSSILQNEERLAKKLIDSFIEHLKTINIPLKANVETWWKRHKKYLERLG